MARDFRGIRAQYGVEETFGTPVPAATSFAALAVSMEPDVETAEIRPQGAVVRTTTYVKRDDSKGKGEGAPTYEGLRDLLTWAYGAVTEDETGTSTWTGVGDPQSRTIEYGDAEDATRVAGVFVEGYEIEWGANSGDAKLTCDLVGGRWEDGHTLTAATRAVETVITAQQVQVYCDSTKALLGTTPVTGVLTGKLKVAKLRSGVKYLTGAQSYTDTTELPPDVTLELKMAGGAAGRGWLTDLRSGATKYVRIAATDDDGHTASIDLCVQADGHARGESDGVYTCTQTLAAAEDPTGFWHGAAVSIT